MNPQAKAQGGKVRKVMHEFGSGKLKSSSGQKVTNPKQAIAIALSEQRRTKGMQVGGSVDYEKLAKQERDAAKKQQSSTPTPAEAAKMREQVEEAKRNAAEKKAPTTRTTMGERLFASGGALRAKLNRQDTRHGKLDMPFSQLNKYAGMRKGGNVKRYAAGGHLESLDSGQSFKDAFREARSSGADTFTWRGKKYTTELAKPQSPAKKVADYGDESARMAARAPAKASLSETRAESSDTEDTRAVAGRVSPLSKKMPSAQQKAENTERIGEGAAAALSLLPAGRGAKAVVEGTEAAAKNAFRTAAEGTKKQIAAREAAYDARRALDMEAGFRKGGKVKEAQMEMRHAKAMKKAGLPKSMVREEMAEAKKYARGGGIESRGKTRGTIIKMASGGHVRGGGCEQRGKTKGKMV